MCHGFDLLLLRKFVNRCCPELVEKIWSIHVLMQKFDPQIAVERQDSDSPNFVTRFRMFQLLWEVADMKPEALGLYDCEAS